MDIRRAAEEREERILSPRAAHSARSRGRLRFEPPCEVRTDFQRDRDRIIHSKAFRRLKDKTQVFVAAAGDHYRTRLTHTLEVSQIARTAAKALDLNEDLTEAVALGHDLGHTPFGHAGEEVFRVIHPGGFEHNLQSLRVVDVLERDHQGLNLTWEVRDGIRNHTGTDLPATLEGQIVRIADRVAYVNHDIDDALRGGVLKEGELPAHAVKVLGSTHSARINTLVRDLIQASRGSEEIRQSPTVGEAMDELRDFLFQRVYIDSPAKREEEKAKELLGHLYRYYREHPEEIYGGLGPRGEEPVQAVLDYVAGMTDRYAIQRYQELFVPAPWRD